MPPIQFIRIRPSVTAAAWPIIIFSIATAVRWPYLWDAPRMTYETREVLRGLSIANGGYFPLTNHDAYIGAFFNYLLAASFWLLGPNPYWPRLMVALFGAGTALLVYWWARDIAGPRAGILAGLLLALSAADIYARAHVAYSNSLTPFFLTLSLYLLDRALARRQPAALVLSGLAGGIAFQTHPSALAVLAGVGLGLVIARRGWLRTPWPYAALLAFVAGAANLLAYHLASGGTSLLQQRPYVWPEGSPLTWASYGRGAGEILSTLQAMVAGATGPQTGMQMAATVASEWTLPLAAMAGLFVGWRRSRWVPGVAVAAWVLLFPLYHTHLESLARYNAGVLPTLFIGLALSAASLAGRFEKGPGRMAMIAAGALAIVLVAVNLSTMYARYEERSLREPSNRHLAQVAEIAARQARPGETTLVDAAMSQPRRPGGAHASHTVGYFLSFLYFRGAARSQEVDLRGAPLTEWVGARGSQLVVAETSEIDRLRQYFAVEIAPESEALLAGAGGDAVPVVARLSRKQDPIPADATQAGAPPGDQR